jgi:hypothetical protein
MLTGQYLDGIPVVDERHVISLVRDAEVAKFVSNRFGGFPPGVRHDEGHVEIQRRSEALVPRLIVTENHGHIRGHGATLSRAVGHRPSAATQGEFLDTDFTD